MESECKPTRNSVLSNYQTEQKQPRQLLIDKTPMPSDIDLRRSQVRIARVNVHKLSPQGLPGVQVTEKTSTERKQIHNQSGSPTKVIHKKNNPSAVEIGSPPRKEHQSDQAITINDQILRFSLPQINGNPKQDQESSSHSRFSMRQQNLRSLQPIMRDVESGQSNVNRSFMGNPISSLFDNSSSKLSDPDVHSNIRKSSLNGPLQSLMNPSRPYDPLPPQAVSLWDAMRLQDAHKYQLELQQSRLDKANRQRQLREFLNFQVQSKKHNIQVVQTQEQQNDRDLIQKKVEELKSKEDLQRQMRKENLKKNIEFNVLIANKLLTPIMMASRRYSKTINFQPK
ncbi:hypothetical protein FGO68_gene14806 [Halteria grandinella]|uniref:Uncharacterized protein n=1 Tax=Halteria grandinella TaxID=5974 RepID=A0A8J8N9T8_HALGN|nr:hypothetical protein FGO68_gene14806 [Halteria grandinella]